MRNDVLIDYQLKGWAKDNEQQIKKDYPNIHYVGEEPNPSASSSDSMLASFCKKHACDLLTCDKEAYAPMLEDRGTKSVQISAYGMNGSSGQQIYAVRAIGS